MKKLFIILIVLGAFSTISFAQASSQLNFGIIGVSYEIPMSSAITIAPAASSNLDLSHLTIGVKANYYLDALIGLPSEWDVYAGANLGYALAIDDNKESDLDFGLQVGGRYFWSPKWGVYLEAGGGKISSGTAGIGLTMKF